jgi:protein O-mannosyl-transferase
MNRSATNGKERAIPFFAGLLFLVLPCHAESVTWISGRTDVIATFFMLISLCMYLYFYLYSKKLFLYISVLSFILALLSKESAIPLPVIINILAVYLYLTNLGKYSDMRRLIFLHSPYFLIIPAYFLLRYVSVGALLGGFGQNIVTRLNFTSFLETIGSQCAKIVLPLPILKYINNYWWSCRLFLPVGYLVLIISALVISLLTAMIIKRNIFIILSDAAKNVLLVGVLFFMFLLTLMPVMGMPISLADSQSDRYAYFPSIFIVMVITLIIQIIFRMKRHSVVILTIITSLYCYTLIQANANWKIAGTISQNIVNKLVKYDKCDHLFVINIPDNLNGAYIFRNGLDHAIPLFMSAPPYSKLIVISFQNLFSQTEDIRVKCSSDRISVAFKPSSANRTSCPDFWINRNLNADGNHPVHIPSGGSFQTPLYGISEFETTGYQIRFTQLRKQDQVVYFTQGQLTDLRCLLYNEFRTLPPNLRQPYDLAGPAGLWGYRFFSHRAGIRASRELSS